MRKYLLTGILFTFIVFPSINRVHAGDVIGGYAGAFLRMGVGPRAQALGDAYTAVREGAYVGLYNPASVAVLPSRQVMASFSLLSLDRKFYAVAVALPLRPKGAGALNGGLSLGWVHAGVNKIDGRDFSGNHIGMFSNSENMFYFSFALHPHKFITIGLNGKILYNSFPRVTENDGSLTSSGFGVDFGVLCMPMNGLSLGFTVHDINSKYTWNTEEVWERGTSIVDNFPVIYRWGAAYQLPQKWLLVTADIEHSKKQEAQYHIGVEGVYSKMLAVRAGLDNGSLRLGLGVEFTAFGKRTGLDYAYVSTVEGLSPDHVFAWIFNF